LDGRLGATFPGQSWRTEGPENIKKAPRIWLYAEMEGFIYILVMKALFPCASCDFSFKIDYHLEIEIDKIWKKYSLAFCSPLPRLLLKASRYLTASSENIMRQKAFMIKDKS
jgi:hypothetical protein